MNHSFHTEAKLEFILAIAYYEDEREGLGLELSREVYAAINRIMLAPNAGSPFIDDTRRFFTRRFPFSIIYQIIDDEVAIFAVAHQKRKPDYWKDRLRN